MPSSFRVAAALVVLAVVLFASPAVAVDLVREDDPRSSRVLGARELGESFEGDPRNETKDLISTWDHEYVLDVQRYAALAARGSTDHLACNQAVDGTVDVFRRATETGSATTTDGDVAAALRCMADRYPYYRGPDDDRREIRAFAVETGDGETRLETRPASDAAVAETVREGERVRYAELNASERETVDRILANDTSSYDGYRPRADDPVLGRTPMLLAKGDATYVVSTVGNVDDVNFAPLFVSLGLYALGVVCLLGAVVAAAVGLYSRRGSDRPAGLEDA